MKQDNNKEAYCELFSSPEDDFLKKINRETHRDCLYAQMLSGHLQGKLLELISKMIKPSRILEIGTFTGYSAICLAKGLQPNGLLYTIEKNDELKAIIEKNINGSGFRNCIELIIGEAIEKIPAIAEKFDLVFIDGDKSEYVQYLDIIFPKLKSGGFILADNVLWSGKVYDKKQQNDPVTKSIMLFNSYVRDYKGLENIILPIRDGVNLIRKL